MTLYIDCEHCGYENILPNTKRVFKCYMCENSQKISYLILPFGNIQEDLKLMKEIEQVNNNG